MTASVAPGEVDEGELLARAAWSRLSEPGDAVASALVGALGAQEALEWLRAQVRAGSVTDGVAHLGPSPAARERLGRAVARWAVRVDALEPARDLGAVRRLGGALLVPGGPAWPAVLDDLGATAPLCLWVRHGSVDLPALLDRSVAVIGARACTAYGEHVTADIAAGLAGGGWTVVSGGAYGVDAAAHRASLAVGGRTVAFGAGGVDRPYPAGNARLLAALMDAGGALVSEVPPGSTPSKSRFLQRNRLIAAAARATVVVEAAWRSGALSTARHAAELLRPVGAVPGPVTSAASAGCHRLLRDGAATCVTDAAEVIELVGAVGVDAVGPRAEDGVGDGLTDVQRQTLDALPVRRAAAATSIARTAGLTPQEVLGALGVLELGGHAVRSVDGWRLGQRARAGQNRTDRMKDRPGRPGSG